MKYTHKETFLILIIGLMLLLIFPTIIAAQKSDIAGKYAYVLRPHPSSVYRVYNLTLNANNTFHITKYYEEFCYNFSDTMTGKWMLKDEVLSFPEINYSTKVKSRLVDTISNNQIIIIEKNLRLKKVSKDKIYLTALDSNFQVIKLFNPTKTTIIEDDTEYKKKLEYAERNSIPIFKEGLIKMDLISYCEIPKETFMVIYHGELYSEPKTGIFTEKGININLDKGENYFTILEMSYIINSSITFKLIDMQNLKSLKPMDSDIGNNEEHEYKLLRN
jgi:hypothetical protein